MRIKRPTRFFRGRRRGRIAALVAAVLLAPAIAACGDDETEPAPAETGTETTAATTDATEPTADEAPADEAPAEDEPTEAESQDAIAATLETVLASTDFKATCGEAVTERYLRRSFGDAAGCEAAQKSAPPASKAGVRQVVILPGSVAQALAFPRGGIYDGQKLRAELVLVDDEWKLDSLRSNVPVGP
jgi:hypothetical protein